MTNVSMLLFIVACSEIWKTFINNVHFFYFLMCPVRLKAVPLCWRNCKLLLQNGVPSGDSEMDAVSYPQHKTCPWRQFVNSACNPFHLSFLTYIKSRKYIDMYLNISLGHCFWASGSRSECNCTTYFWIHSHFCTFNNSSQSAGITLTSSSLLSVISLLDCSCRLVF